jgi:hypothetical protein
MDPLSRLVSHKPRLAITMKAVCACGESSSGGIFRVGRDKRIIRYTAGGLRSVRGGGDVVGRT